MIIYKLVFVFFKQMQSLIIVTTSKKKKKKVHSIEFQKRFIEYKQFNSGKRETEGIFTLSSHPLTELISDKMSSIWTYLKYTKLLYLHSSGCGWNNE